MEMWCQQIWFKNLIIFQPYLFWYIEQNESFMYLLVFSNIVSNAFNLQHLGPSLLFEKEKNQIQPNALSVSNVLF